MDRKSATLFHCGTRVDKRRTILATGGWGKKAKAERRKRTRTKDRCADGSENKKKNVHTKCPLDGQVRHVRYRGGEAQRAVGTTEGGGYYVSGLTTTEGRVVRKGGTSFQSAVLRRSMREGRPVRLE